MGLREMAFHSQQPPSSRAQKRPALCPSFLVGETPGRAIDMAPASCRGKVLGQWWGDRHCSSSLDTGQPPHLHRVQWQEVNWT